jgi:hypothetical protein
MTWIVDFYGPLEHQHVDETWMRDPRSLIPTRESTSSLVERSELWQPPS